jgi:thiosulfate/3-mercaptopyruvate sulfurtransferase
MKKRLAVLLVLLVLLVCPALTITAHAKDNYKGYVKGEVFITPQELNSLIQAKDPKLVIIAVAGSMDYYLGHIPGAFHMWRSDYEADPATQGGVTDNLLQPEGFSKLMQKVGVNADSKVVVYDHKYDATRLWWAFYYYGKTDVRVLDGGLKAWTKAGYGTDMLASKAPAQPGTWTARIAHPTYRVDTPEVMGLKDRKDAQLWDVRGDSEFCGKETKQGAFRAGRIPWGVQADYVLVKTKENDAEWLPAAEAQQAIKKLEMDPKKQQYFYCQSGVRVTQWIITLYALGWSLDKIHNYDSSWIRWSMDPKLPIETGCPDTTPAPWQKK